jgi:hypothetical protein
MSSISSQFSVYIPRVFENIPNEKIVKSFEYLDLGKVDKMDVKYRTGVDGTRFKMVFIHFKEWYSNSAAVHFRERVENPEVDAKLVYDDPWHWIVLPNKSAHADTSKNMPLLSICSDFNVDECMMRIDDMEKQLNKLYQNLLCRTNNEEYVEGDIETGNMTRMTMRELEDDDSTLVDDYTDVPPFHITENLSNIHHQDSYYDDVMSISTDEDAMSISTTDEFYDLEKGGSHDSYTMLVGEDKTLRRQWMTANICGNH